MTARHSSTVHAATILALAGATLAALIITADAASAAGATSNATTLPGTRDPLKWPFSATSIWNMPIGSDAQYIPARIPPPRNGVSADTDVIVLTPTAPLVNVYTNQWTARCARGASLGFQLPIPANFVWNPGAPGNYPNSSGAVLWADGDTVRETQPLTICSAGGPAGTGWKYTSGSIRGDGTYQGSHGGSYLSALGGSLRVGELRPTSGHVRHALKIEFNGTAYYNNGQANSHRWPAKNNDDVAGYTGTNPAVLPGALLAIPASVSIASLGLETAPGRELAWTLQNYGAYIVDNAAWDVVAWCAEYGPNGTFVDQFAADYGYAFVQLSYSSGGQKPTAWGRDQDRIIAVLSVVDNNSANSIGGGGTPLQPLAPPFQGTARAEPVAPSNVVVK